MIAFRLPSRSMRARSLIVCAAGLVLSMTSPVARAESDWTMLPAPLGSSGQPSARYGHGAFYDPRGDRMILFGGFNSETRFLTDVWTLTLGATRYWEPITPAGSPPPGRYGFSTAYDRLRHRMIVIGGASDGSPSIEVHALTLGESPEWSRIVPEGEAPKGRYGHTAVHDPIHDRLILFGGHDGRQLLRDVWELSLSPTPTWTRLLTRGPGPVPPPRSHHVAVFDSLRQRMLVYGGSVEGSAVSDVWSLSLGVRNRPVWATHSPAGVSPPPRFAAAADYDASHDRLVIFSGWNGAALNDVWMLGLTGGMSWTRLPTTLAPTPRYGGSLVIHPATHGAIAFGGAVSGSSSSSRHWLDLDSGDWTNLVVTFPVTIPAMSGHSLIVDSHRRRAIVFGKRGVWSLPLPSSRADWISLGSGPPSHIGHSVIYDRRGGRALVFGGYDRTYLNGVHQLSLLGDPHWGELPSPSPRPGPRAYHSAVYDGNRHKMVVFGGTAEGWGGMLGDVWVYDMTPGRATWTLLTPSGGRPLPRHSHAMVFDERFDRVLVFGGVGPAGPLNDLWALHLSPSPRWERLAIAGAPSPRYSMSLVMDRPRNRALLFAGCSSVAQFNDLYALELDEVPRWVGITTGTRPGGRHLHAAAVDAETGQLIIQGGASGFGSMLRDTWLLSLASAEAVAALPERMAAPEEAALRDFELTGVSPNPLRDHARVRFTLPGRSAVRVETLDLSGRRVGASQHMDLSPGPHELAIPAVSKLRPGLYFVRVAAGGRESVFKISVVP